MLTYQGPKATRFNPKFSPYDLSEFTSVQTMESKIMKYLFPEGHKVKNLTRQRDGKQLVLHYIPYTEAVRRLLRNEAFAGKMYHNFEVQWSARRNGVRAIGRSNSGTLFEGAQIRANRLAAGSGYMTYYMNITSRIHPGCNIHVI